MSEEAGKELKSFTLEELKSFDGREGRPAYVAYQGMVYDVSGSAEWEAGEHLASHYAGQDLTQELQDAPHGEEVFKNVPVVGKLEA